jgi:hypothetical protein
MESPTQGGACLLPRSRTSHTGRPQHLRVNANAEWERGLPLIASRTTRPPSLRSFGETPAVDARMPTRTPSAASSTSFHFDDERSASAASCCVCACNEQNGQPGGDQLRRVGENRRRMFPNTTRSYLSMGMQPLCRADMFERLSGGRLQQGSGDRHRAAQRRRLHRLPVLHLELLVWGCRNTTPSAASSASATCATVVCRWARRRPV